MPTFDTVRRVPYSPEQMFDLVADVEQYPQFLPMCETLAIRRRETTPEGERLTATMGVGYKSIREHFTSRVTLKPADRRIQVAYLDGPFRYLDNRWEFLPMAGGGCQVRFWISYEFKSAMLGLLMGALFDKAFRKFAEAFEQRARVVYGAPAQAVGGA
jgi:coenzyme Q-binding protein COQ10